ncbi:hypothetical protein [Zeimonas arvi]|uniref:DUF4238 domain-containing protein n=1 Tax=Zeimonas arvi TaxID=2498847 RepID=A0A5C8NUC9_9BURK|nr:hypothetical protein [Zeimonas arvi]TXL64775.1 hypothetical protein FHP08_13645 [Zeimonas arvi]
MTEQEFHHPLRPFLRNWLWEHGRVGTRYLDCANGEIRFDEGKKARFAAEQPIHVPLVANAGDAAIDTGPAVHEAGLAQFLRAAQLGRPEAAGSPPEVQRAVQDCVEIGLACAYQPDAQRAWARYALEPLLLSESPFIDWRVRARPPVPFVSMPLGPYCLLVGTPSNKTRRAGPVSWQNVVAMGPFRDHNRHIVETARLWVVATGDEQLAALQARFAPPAAPQPAAGGA